MDNSIKQNNTNPLKAKTFKFIPKHAKQVFSGVLFSIYQWPQKLYNGKIATFEAVTRPDTVAIIALTKDNKVIVTKEKQPDYNEWFYSVPGGRVEPNEDILITAKREFLEETGYIAQELTYYKPSYLYRKIDFATHIFLGKNAIQQTSPQLDAGEKIKIELFTPKDFIELVFTEEFKYPNITMLIAWAINNPQKYSQLLQHLKYI